MPIIPEDILKEFGVADLRAEQLTVDQFIQLAAYVAKNQPT